MKSLFLFVSMFFLFSCVYTQEFYQQESEYLNDRIKNYQQIESDNDLNTNEFVLDDYYFSDGLSKIRFGKTISVSDLDKEKLEVILNLKCIKYDNTFYYKKLMSKGFLYKFENNTSFFIVRDRDEYIIGIGKGDTEEVLNFFQYKIKKDILETNPTLYASRFGSSYGDTDYGYSGGGSDRVYVKGYYRKNGTYVNSHTRSKPRRK